MRTTRTTQKHLVTTSGEGRALRRQRYTISGLAVWSVCLLLANSVQAAPRTKADNTTALNLAGSWVENAVPGASDTLIVSNNLTADRSAALGGAISAAGIQVGNGIFGLTVTPSSTATLTLGAGGIDMTAAGADLILGCPMALGAANTWDVAAGRTLRVTNVSANLNATAGAIQLGANTLTIQGAGDVVLSNSTAIACMSGTGGLIKTGDGILTLGSSNRFSGPVTISGGTVRAYGGTGFRGVFGEADTITITNGTLNAVAGNNAPFGNPGGAATQGTPASLKSGDVVLKSGGVLTIGSGITAHIPRVLVMSGGELASSGTVLSTFGTWNLEQGVVVSNSTATSTISAQGVALNQQGGTIINVVGGAASGIDLDVTGYFGHPTSLSDNGFIKTGAGVMRLQGANTHTGNSVISNGVLKLSGTGSIFNSAQILVHTNATFDVSETTFALSSGQILGGSGVVTGTVFVAGNGTLSPGFSSPATTATLSFSNNVILSGSSTNAFKLSNNPNGPANDRIVVAGNLDVSPGFTVVQINATTLGVGRYILFKYGSLSGSAANMTLSGVVANGRQSVSLDDTVPGEIALVVAGTPANVRWVGDNVANNWDINGTQNWFNLGTSAADFYFDGDFVLFNDSGSKSPDVNLTTTLLPASVTVSNTTGTYTFSGGGGISGSTGLTKKGAGALVIANGVNDYTGGTVVAGGTVSVGSFSVLGAGKLTVSNAAIVSVDADLALGVPPSSAVSNQLTLDNGTLQTTADFTMSANRGVTLGSSGGTVDTATGTTLTYAGPISGDGDLTKNGDGTLRVTMANNPYTGKTIINGGTISMNGITRLGAVPSVLVPDQITINNGARLLYTAAALSTSAPERGIKIGASGGIIECNANGTMVIEGPISGTGNLTNSGSTANFSTIEIANPTNSLSGDVCFVSGFFRVDGDGQFGTGTLRWNGGGLTANNDRSTTANFIANAIEMTGDFILRANSSSVGETISPRNIVFSTDSFTTSGGTWTINNNASGSNAVHFAPWLAGAINFTQPIVLNNSATRSTYLTFGNTNGTTQTISGEITGSGIVRRSALSGTGGTTILTGNNGYTGGTEVDNGTLLVNNTTGSGTGTGAVTVTAPGTLGGTGTISGAVSGNGTIAPGLSAGTLTLEGGLDLSSGGTYRWELAANSTSNPGTDFDQLSLTGSNLVLGGTSKMEIAFTGSATTPNASNPFWQSARSWRVINLAGATNPGDTTFASVVNGTTPAGTFSTTADANGILLNFTPGAVTPPVISPNIVGAGTANATITWSAQNGVNYQVQYKNDLTAASWSVLGSVTASGSTASISDTTGPVPKRFYRIVVQ